MLPYTASGGRRMSPEKEASPQDSSPPPPSEEEDIACHCHNRNADELPKNTMAPSNTAYPTASG
ncbi:hypothetical protein GE21DRAFT_1306434 [Neurospora crassa]|nr:hypothetical protein GE21DRAFT_1306434 [Neurospora crassa]